MTISRWHICGGDLTSGPRDDCPDELHDYPLPAGYTDASEAAARRLYKLWTQARCAGCGLYGWRPCDERVPAGGKEKGRSEEERG